MAHWVALNKVQSSLPILVFIHGWGAEACIWQDLSRALPGKHVALELPGFGSAPNEEASLDQYIEDVSGELPGSCVLVGWSLGGMLATRLAHLNTKKVKGLITLATNLTFIQRDDWPCAMPEADFLGFESIFKEQAQKVYKRFLLLQTKNDPQAKFVLQNLKALNLPSDHTLSCWAESLSWLAELDNRQYVNKTIVQRHILGQLDSLVPVAVAQELESLGLDTVVLEGAAHALPISHIKLVANVILKALAPFDVLPKARIARSFSEHASTYDQAAIIQKHAANKLVSTMPEAVGEMWLDLGCGTGFVQDAMHASNKNPSTLIEGDIALGMLRHIKHDRPNATGGVLDAEHLPLAPEVLEGVVSNLAVQWCDLGLVAKEVFRVLKPGGCWVFSTLVEGSLNELQSAWQEVDCFTHVNHFLPKAEVTSVLCETGFCQPDQNTYVFVDKYLGLIPLLRSLKNIGAHNMNLRKAPGLTSRRQLLQLEAAYTKLQLDCGHLPVSYVVCQVIVYKPE